MTSHDSHLNFPESEVGQFVHEAVEQSWGAGRVHTELTLRGEVVGLLQGKRNRGDLYATPNNQAGHFHSLELLGLKQAQYTLWPEESVTRLLLIVKCTHFRGCKIWHLGQQQKVSCLLRCTGFRGPEAPLALP